MNKVHQNLQFQINFLKLTNPNLYCMFRDCWEILEKGEEVRTK